MRNVPACARVASFPFDRMDERRGSIFAATNKAGTFFAYEVPSYKRKPNMMYRLFFSSVSVILLFGCNTKVREVAPPEPTIAPVCKPLQGEVTDYVEFTGRTNAVESVNIIPRVTGY